MSDPTHKDDDSAFDANAAKIQAGLEARVQLLKVSLARWTAEQPRAQVGGAITLAILELGIERHLDLFSDEESAADLVQGVLRKVMSRQRGTIQ